MSNFAIQSFGVFAVTIMVICYALENRGPVYVAGFAAGCVLSAIYALMMSSYPFVFAESVWAIVAFRRYRSLTAELVPIKTTL